MFFAGYLCRILRGSERRDDWLAALVLITAAADVSVKLGSGEPSTALPDVVLWIAAVSVTRMVRKTSARRVRHGFRGAR